MKFSPDEWVIRLDIDVQSAEESAIDHRELRSRKGTGLGLALARGLADLQQGRIDVEPIEGRGSTFTVTLPVDCDESSAIQ